MTLRTPIALALTAMISFVQPSCKSDLPTGPDTNWTIEISGIITQNGLPIAGVVVYLSWGNSRQTMTGADGKFSFTKLSPGNYIITPSSPGVAFFPSNFEVNGQNAINLTFTTVPPAFGSEKDRIATNFTARDQNGNPVTLFDYHGKVVLMDFTADWCTPCREKAQTAEAFYQKYKDKGFIYILVVIEGNPSVWASTYGLTFPVLDDNSQAIYNIYRRANIPLPHVMDRNMTIRYKGEGWKQNEVEEMLSKYL